MSDEENRAILGENEEAKAAKKKKIVIAAVVIAILIVLGIVVAVLTTQVFVNNKDKGKGKLIGDHYLWQGAMQIPGEGKISVQAFRGGKILVHRERFEGSPKAPRKYP